jgi:hypothetical protein
MPKARSSQIKRIRDCVVEAEMHAAKSMLNDELRKILGERRLKNTTPVLLYDILHKYPKLLNYPHLNRREDVAGYIFAAFSASISRHRLLPTADGKNKSVTHLGTLLFPKPSYFAAHNLIEAHLKASISIKYESFSSLIQSSLVMCPACAPEQASAANGTNGHPNGSSGISKVNGEQTPTLCLHR